MSVLSRRNWLSQQRVDIPHLRALESSIAADFDLLAGTMFCGARSYVLAGFTLPVGGIGNAADALQLTVANAIIMHVRGSEAGTMFVIDADASAELLTPTNTRVTGSFTASQDNYVGLDLRRRADSDSSDLVQFLDADTNSEAARIVPLSVIMDYKLVITTQSFAVNANLLPITIVTTDAQNAVTAITDARPMLFRLATGGDSPEVDNYFPWEDRIENDITATSSSDPSPFTSGDKEFVSFKDWMDGVMTRLWEVGGGEKWFSPTSDRDVKVAYSGDVLENGFNVQFILSEDAIDWDAQATPFVLGESINGATSGATAVVSEIWDNGTTGTLILTSVVGTFQNNENLREGVTVRAVANGANYTMEERLRWKGISVIFANSTASSNTITDDVTGVTIEDGQCLYVDLRRDSAVSIVAAIATLTDLGMSTLPGQRFIIAWRLGDFVYFRDAPYEAGRNYEIATTTSFGDVRIYNNDDEAWDAGTPEVLGTFSFAASYGAAQLDSSGDYLRDTVLGTEQDFLIQGVLTATPVGGNQTAIVGNATGTGFGVSGNGADGSTSAGVGVVGTGGEINGGSGQAGVGVVGSGGEDVSGGGTGLGGDGVAGFGGPNNGRGGVFFGDAAACAVFGQSGLSGIGGAFLGNGVADPGIVWQNPSGAIFAQSGGSAIAVYIASSNGAAARITVGGSGKGVHATTGAGDAVFGSATTGYGVYGTATGNFGVYGEVATAYAGVHGHNTSVASGAAVQGVHDGTGPGGSFSSGGTAVTASAGGNGNGVTATGAGTGYGFHGTGIRGVFGTSATNAGYGGYFSATNGTAGVGVFASAVEGDGVQATGGGAGDGVQGTGGSTSGAHGVRGIAGGSGANVGVHGTGAAGGGTGVEGAGGATAGIGVKGTSGAAGYGVHGVGGTSSSFGGYFEGGTTNGIGAQGVGRGSGAGIVGTVVAGGTAAGGSFVGGSGGGDGVVAVGQAGGNGVSATGQGVGTGVSGTGGNTSGAGVTGVGGTNGNGVRGSAAGSGAGGYFTASGSGKGVYGDAGGAGEGGHFISTSGVGARGVSGSDRGVSGESVSGTGVYGLSGAHYAGEFEGDDANPPARAALRIVPQAAQPSDGQIGDIYVTTAGVLKICTVAGSPGTWVSVGAQ